MALRIFNVLGREKQDFVPLQAGKVGMYVCGPTVNDHPHIGHAKKEIAFDVIARYLRFSGYDVLHIENITDVGHLLDSGEDRILKKAAQTQSKPMAIAQMYERSYFKAMDALGVRRADINPLASGHIPEQIKMIETLIAKEHAYVVNGSVYYDVSSNPDYGKLSNRRIDEQESGTREAVRGEKRNPEDFALWKRAEPEHILRWDSPWGVGFPGWHIECSAMALKYLGPTFDIHGGGVDNIFPHNESEIAQSECANDAEFARYWMLVGTLTVDGIKMSKSIGNVVSVHDMVKRYPAEAIRMFLLAVHYSNPLDYTDEAFTASQRGWERLYNAVRLARRAVSSAPDTDDGSGFLPRLEQARADFIAAMDDDFNTPLAIATLQELTREVNGLLNSGQPVGKSVLNAIISLYDDLGGGILGIVPVGENDQSASAEREAALIEMLIDMRKQARAAKNWAESDRIRDALAAAGVILEDRPDGTIWKLQ